MIIKPKIFSSFTNITAAQSTRKGGFSQSPYDSMNLGSNTDDDKETLLKNKEFFCKELGFEYAKVAKSKQVHSDEILVCEAPGSYEGYDALITDKENIFICVSTADCVPILIYDINKKVIAAIHAGWKGTHLQLVSKTLIKMLDTYGTEINDCCAFIGPSIGECSFEVDADVAKYFDEPYSRFDSELGKYFIDLKAHNRNQILNLGVDEKNIEVSPYDTFSSTDLFYSHRKENGVTGRMWTGLMLKN
jgi:polyphenol oxidase